MFKEKKMIFLTTIYPSCKQASYYLGVDFKCNFWDQIVYAKHVDDYIYYPITKNGTVLNQYEINLNFQISNINNKYYVNSIVRKYKYLCLLNPYNIYVPLCGQTYLLDYRQLRQDEVQIQSSITQNISPNTFITNNSNIYMNITSLLNNVVITIQQSQFNVSCLQQDESQIINYLEQPQLIQCVLNQILAGGNTTVKGYINFIYNVSVDELPTDNGNKYKVSSFIGDIPFINVQGLGEMNGRLQYTLSNGESTTSNEYTGDVQMYLNPKYQIESPHNLNFSRIGVHTIGWQLIVIGVVFGVATVVFIIWSIIQQRNSFGGYLNKKSVGSSKQ